MKTKTALVVGGTDGIGAAVALELCKQGARVIIIGRSKEKASNVVEASKMLQTNGTIEVVVSDFSLMNNVKNTVKQLKESTTTIDVLVYTVGILITKTEHTPEGIEKDFAVSYLSRFVCTEELQAQGLLTDATIMLNVAASAPKVPSYAQMEFSNVQEVQSRVGMKSHGQAQLANDIFTQFAASRYGITTIGYGPGSVNTNIRRELPKFLVALVQPFFAFSTREPQEVGRQIASILANTNLKKGQAQYFDKNGAFTVSPFIADSKRQNELLATSIALSDYALSKDYQLHHS